MQERQITVDGETKPLPRPFLVLATQNPIELEGTFPLPEAQVDRFLLKIKIGYPTEEEENRILLRFEQEDPLEDLQPVTTASELLDLQAEVRRIRVERSVREYLVRVARATREHPSVDLGVSPRGTLSLYKTAQALAAIRGRDYVIPDDVKELAPYVLTHRILISPQTRLRGRTPEEVVMEVIDEVPVPVEKL
jgi:MoxR-like ATPase